MGKKAREKRDRRDAPGAAAPRGDVRPPPSASTSKQARRSVAAGLGWPSWPASDATIDGRWIAVLVSVAFLVRVFLLLRVVETPYLEVDNIDARGYQLWARQILEGGWTPKAHFYQSPLYAYYLASVQTLFGLSPWAPRIIQVLLGTASVALLAVIGTRLFNRRIGLLAGAMLALYGPMILEEITLSKTSLLIFGALLGFLLYLRARDGRSPLGMAMAGLVFGLTTIGVGQWLVGLLGLTLFAALDPSLPRPLRPRLAALFLGGALVALGPIVAWNSSMGGGLILSSGDAGLNLYLGNNPTATALTGRPRGLRDVPEFEEGDSRRLAEAEAGGPLTPAEVSSHWTRSAVGWALGHPVDFVVNTFRKVTVLWNSFEIPDSYHFAFVQQHYIRWFSASLTFAIVGPLAIVGLVLAVRHRPARPLYVVCLCYLGVVTLFYVRSRYRLPALPFLMIFAAAAVDWLVRTVERRAWGAAGALAAGGFVAAVAVNHTYCEPARPDAPAICLGGDAWFDLEWQKLAEWHLQRGEHEKALAYLHRAAAGESIRGPGGLQFRIGQGELFMAQRSVDAGDKAAASAHLSAATEAFQRALERSYRVVDTRNGLTDVRRLQATLGQ